MAENVLEFNDGNFQQEVLDSSQPVLVDFWAPWCGPCRMLTPVIQELATDYADSVRVGKVNVDEAQQTAMTYGVTSIPTVILFKNGQVAGTLQGALPKAKFKELIDSNS